MSGSALELSTGSDPGASVSTMRWLASGGDGRLEIDPATKLNRYGCASAPRPSAASFASSTASSISLRGFGRAEHVLASFARLARVHGGAAALDSRIEILREDLADLFGLNLPETDIVFSPSGTDSQLHALALARAWLGTPLTTMVVAGDETGSGTVFTAAGRHFGDRTAQGRAVVHATPIDGLDGIAPVVRIDANNTDGAVALGTIDAAVIAAVSRAVAARQKVLLQAMNCSKFGRRCPSDDCLAVIRSRWGDHVQIVVDACQMRLSRARLRRHLDLGDMVIVTGSKFFTGPAFSGALLVPWRIRRPLGEPALAAGLRDYTCREDWPWRWRGMRDRLPGRTALGPWLRWEAAVAEMRAYFDVPLPFRHQALRGFSAAAQSLLFAGCRRPLHLPQDSEADDLDEEFGARTIFPFLVKDGAVATAARLHRDLNRDMSTARPEAAATAGLAAMICHIGQPVRLTRRGIDIAALRVSADARVVVDGWSSDPIQAQRNCGQHLEGLRRTFEKLELLEGAAASR